MRVIQTKHSRIAVSSSNSELTKRDPRKLAVSPNRSSSSEGLGAKQMTAIVLKIKPTTATTWMRLKFSFNKIRANTALQTIVHEPKQLSTACGVIAMDTMLMICAARKKPKPSNHHGRDRYESKFSFFAVGCLPLPSPFAWASMTWEYFCSTRPSAVSVLPKRQTKVPWTQIGKSSDINMPSRPSRRGSNERRCGRAACANP
mmetsp:Transcript_64406/g.179085  ORF Transcript_64406/g.179085 Transcript_64406/m.179085 type:complete len:202 (+) Transcript_64406:1047-1652(+)